MGWSLAGEVRGGTIACFNTALIGGSALCAAAFCDNVAGIVWVVVFARAAFSVV